MEFNPFGMRHLEDENMLKSKGHDAPLKEGQESLLIEPVEKIIRECNEKGITRVDIIASGQTRTTQTGKMVKEQIKEHSSHALNVKLMIDKRLMDLNQGILDLPEEYNDGDNFAPLKSAWEAFWTETFEKQNFLYKFGDPIMEMDGSTRYPALRGAFKECGENYAQFCQRFYDFLVDFVDQYAEKQYIMPVIIGHNATHALLHEFGQISADFSKEVVLKPIELGDLPNITWNYFQKMRNDVLSRNPMHGELTVYNLTGLVSPDIREIVSVERDLLRAKILQSKS